VTASPAATGRQAAGRGAFVLLAVITVFWGLNWPVMKVALSAIPVLPFRALCMLASGPALLAIAAAKGPGIAVPRRDILPLLLAALFNVTLWHVFTGYGVSAMPAGRASIIAYTMPAWAALLGALVLGERLTRARLAGLALGMGGVAALVLPDFASVAAAPLGAVSMILAALCWAAGTVVMKAWRWSASTVTLTGWQVLIGGLPILVAAVVVGPFPGLERAGVPAIAALIYVVVFGMLIGQWAWFVVLARLPVTVASISSLAIPVVGVLSSALLLGERLGPSEILALVLVLAAIALVLRPGIERG
jgi:drug/metabolite transporter (DMT)-like permease